MTSQKQKALVTGAAGGMGQAIARRLVEDGFDVFITDINADALEAAAADIGHGVETMACDLGDPVQREHLLERTGSLFALVNNAGIFSTRDADELNGADFLRMYEINTVAAFELAKLAAVSMRPLGGGRIVNISSRSFLGAVKVAHYAASKGALSTLTKCLALEWAADNILVNAVAPGVIETPILQGWNDEERARLASYQPLGRIGRPEDIANVVSMLASPATDYLTGQVIVVDGGRSVGGGNV
ncbi:SDR family oxidoreductase [Billgrantia pellis]|uniref:SDR family oxidoreductase n=1 Tax=Billgrantia pellis TaxID=2606936 RepID=A0A7V7KJT2_9GAMM|nr:SDR family NAD(P)-dependent oxidoreductase [Halomonas pellis]KAA0014586.1 SDR family oxidoreductase [Halomonas pellis]